MKNDASGPGAIPEGMNQSLIDALKRYAMNRAEPGGFLRAVLENDLANSFGRADDENRRNLHEIVKYVWNELPSGCWGSKEKVTAWLDSKYCSLECDVGCSFSSADPNVVRKARPSKCEKTVTAIIGSLAQNKEA